MGQASVNPPDHEWPEVRMDNRHGRSIKLSSYWKKKNLYSLAPTFKRSGNQNKNTNQKHKQDKQTETKKPQKHKQDKNPKIRKVTDVVTCF